MRGTALGLGIGGSAVGVLVWILQDLTGAIVAHFRAVQGAAISSYAWGTLAVTMIGFVGAGLAIGKPRIASGLLIIACLGGFFTVGRYWTLPGALLFVAALMAYLGRNGGRQRARAGIPEGAIRSDDGRWWWDGARWQPVGPISDR